MEQPRTFGRYTILEVLGVGGMGTVYRALDPLLERTVAIKVLDGDYGGHGATPESDEAWARFRNEARAAARLNHPAIVSIYDFSDAAAASAYFAMEYVDGVTLDHYMGESRPLRAAHAFELIVQLLAGLGYAHAQGVVHRDIKPSNLMVTRAGQLKIADFGIAQIESLKLTQTGMLVGTPQYMAPEQYQGHAVDARCDLYAAGSLLFQLLTGVPPFRGSANEIMYQICHVPAPAASRTNPAVPTLLDPLVARALAKDPVARFQTAAEFSRAIEAARSALGLTEAEMVRAPLPPPELTALSTAASRAPVSPSPALRTTGTPDGWSSDELAAIEQRLALIMGPMARILVKRAAAQTTDRERLCEDLAEQLRSDEERGRFWESLPLRSAAAAGGRAPPPGSGARTDLDAATRERTTSILARYLGPIAAVVVRKTAADAVSDTDLYARLAQRIADPKDRAQFLAEVARSQA